MDRSLIILFLKKIPIRSSSSTSFRSQHSFLGKAPYPNPCAVPIDSFYVALASISCQSRNWHPRTSTYATPYVEVYSSRDSNWAASTRARSYAEVVTRPPAIRSFQHLQLKSCFRWSSPLEVPSPHFKLPPHPPKGF